MKLYRYLFTVAIIGCGMLFADDHMLSSSVDDGLTFYCSFDNSVNANKAIGKSQGISHFKNKLQFTSGVKNTGLRIGKSFDGKEKSLSKMVACLLFSSS